MIKDLIRDTEAQEKMSKKKSSSEKCTEKSSTSFRAKGSDDECRSNDKSNSKEGTPDAPHETKIEEDTAGATVTAETVGSAEAEVGTKDDSLNDFMDE